ncbi:MAG: hypothetical protein ACK5LX_00150 [Oscillospiraceae bacterium]
MSTSATSRDKLWKYALVQLALAALCIVVTNIYALFGHGVRSGAMDYMFLYPLCMGAIPYSLLALLCSGIQERRCFRAAVNLYNSGIAAFTVGGLLKGILDIAGTASSFQPLFPLAGGILATAGLLLLLPGKSRSQ